MNEQFQIILNKNPSLSLEAIGILALMCLHDNGKFEFNTRESFLDYFHIDSHVKSEIIFAELIEKNLLVREKQLDKHIYHLKRTRIRLLVPIKYSESKPIQKYIEDQLEKFKSNSIKNSIKEALIGLKENMSLKGSKLRIQDVEKFFLLFKDVTNKQIGEFISVYHKKELHGKVGIKYYESVIKNIKASVKDIETVSDSLKWNEKKQKESDNKFAIKLVTGDIVGSAKYDLMVKKGQFKELRQFWTLGKTLVDPRKIFYYDWIEKDTN